MTAKFAEHTPQLEDLVEALDPKDPRLRWFRFDSQHGSVVTLAELSR